MHYRLYLLGGDGRIMRGIDLDCRDEAEAAAIARDHPHDHARELWHGSDRVMQCDAPGPTVVVAPVRNPVHFLGRCNATYTNGIGGLDG